MLPLLNIPMASVRSVLEKSRVPVLTPPEKFPRSPVPIQKRVSPNWTPVRARNCAPVADDHQNTASARPIRAPNRSMIEPIGISPDIIPNWNADTMRPYCELERWKLARMTGASTESVCRSMKLMTVMRNSSARITQRRRLIRGFGTGIVVSSPKLAPSSLPRLTLSFCAKRRIPVFAFRSSSGLVAQGFSPGSQAVNGAWANQALAPGLLLASPHAFCFIPRMRQPQDLVYVFDIPRSDGIHPLFQRRRALFRIHGNALLPGCATTKNSMEVHPGFGSQLQRLNKYRAADSGRKIHNRTFRSLSGLAQ